VGAEATTTAGEWRAGDDRGTDPAATRCQRHAQARGSGERQAGTGATPPTP